MSTSTFSDLITPIYRKVQFDEWQAKPVQYRDICRVEQAKEYTPRMSRISSFAKATTKAETVAATEHTMSQMYDASWTLYAYSNYYKVSKEAIDNDLYNIIDQAPKALGKAHREAMEVSAANTFNNGFTTALADAKALFASDHPLVAGSASNYVNADLSLATLEAALVAMRGTVDDQGKKILVTPTKLIVPAALEPTAYKLLQSALDPESANNTSNWVNSRKLQLVVNDFLTDDDSWYLAADEHTHVMFIGKGSSEMPELSITTAADMTLDQIVQTYNRFGCGVCDWRGLYGAEGK
jgi:phage major head subunit gpT-like protein